MPALFADRLSGGRAVACGALLALLLIPGTAFAAQDVRSTWRAQGLQGYDGIVSYRIPIVVRDRDAAVLLGPPAYGGYEVYAGTRLLGRSRGWSSPLAFGFSHVFRVSAEAIGGDGTVVLTLRARRIGWISDRDPESGPVSGVLTTGEYRRPRGPHPRQLERPSARGGSAARPGRALRVRRPPPPPALQPPPQTGRAPLVRPLALAFAINTFASTYWIYELTASRASRHADERPDRPSRRGAGDPVPLAFLLAAHLPSAPRLSALPCRAGRFHRPVAELRPVLASSTRAGSGSCRCW